MKKIRNNIIVFAAGGCGYAGLEILWRGYSHWSMAAAGGICFLLLMKIFRALARAPIYFKAILGGIVITSVELVFGLIFNIFLGEKVWDYSGAKGNILGQICPVYSVIWCLLCVPVSIFEKRFGKYFFRA